jgi:hypothetical protein
MLKKIIDLPRLSFISIIHKVLAYYRENLAKLYIQLSKILQVTEVTNIKARITRKWKVVIMQQKSKQT